jgi:hypothetical protein
LMLSRSAIQLESHDEDDSDDVEDSLPLPMDNENDISLHYSGMMRRLDREHRKDSQTKDREINVLKQQLEEKDHVYRQQFREMRFTIEDLQQQLEHMKNQLEENERTVEVRIERAIFKTEDTWEQRWRDQETLYRKRLKQMEEEAQKQADPLHREVEQPSGNSPDVEAGHEEDLTGSPKTDTTTDQHRSRWPPSIMSRERRFI